MRPTTTLAIGSLCLLAAGMARAADQTILGNVLVVKNPSTPVKRKIVGKAKEAGSPNTIVGNPTVGGATLTVRADGGTSTTQTFTLPQGVSGMTGKPFWSGDALKGFKYKDPRGENSAVKSVQIRKSASGVFLIKAVVSGKIGTVSVVPPDPGIAGCVLLAVTGGDSYSVFFGAPSTLVNKDGQLFKAKKPTAEGSCFPTTTTTSTTTTSSTTSTTLYGSPSRAFVDRVLGLLD
jgi:hypothetical protein